MAGVEPAVGDEHSGHLRRLRVRLGCHQPLGLTIVSGTAGVKAYVDGRAATLRMCPGSQRLTVALLASAPSVL